MSSNRMPRQDHWRSRLQSWWNGNKAPPTAVAPMARPARAVERRIRLNRDNLPAQVFAAQCLWGEGFLKPGDGDAMIALVTPLRLVPRLEVLELGAGLGGAARAVVAAFQVSVTALEESRELVEAGERLAARDGQAHLAVLLPFDPELVELPERKYDRVICRELMSNLVPKARLLRQIMQTLHGDGELLISDFVVSDACENAIPTGCGLRHPWTAAAMVQLQKENGYEIRSVDDMTDWYLQLVREGFRRIEQAMPPFAEAGPEEALVLRTALTRELELWTRRVALLQDGQLRLYRFHAQKIPSGKLMSDW